MLELYLNKPEELVLRETPAPGPVKDSQARIMVTHGGVCGSDLRVYKGSIPYATYPVRPGHEVLGVIIEAGNEVRHKAGTRVYHGISFPMVVWTGAFVMAFPGISGKRGFRTGFHQVLESGVYLLRPG